MREWFATYGLGVTAVAAIVIGIAVGVGLPQWRHKPLLVTAIVIVLLVGGTLLTGWATGPSVPGRVTGGDLLHGDAAVQKDLSTLPCATTTTLATTTTSTTDPCHK